jgi:DedD protein
VSIGALLVWMIVAGAGGAVAWDFYGSEVRSRLGILREGAPRVSASESPPETPANGEVVALVKDLQTSQKRTADQLEAALQMLTSEQAASRTMADTLAVLGAKVDALQRPAAAPAAKRPAPAPLAAVAPPRRPPPAARPPAPNPSPDPDQPEPAPGAPTGSRQ